MAGVGAEGVRESVGGGDERDREGSGAEDREPEPRVAGQGGVASNSKRMGLE